MEDVLHGIATLTKDQLFPLPSSRWVPAVVGNASISNDVLIAATLLKNVALACELVLACHEEK